MKKLSFFKRLLKGDNLIGQILYGVVDILPFPNLLNIPRAILKDRPEVRTVELLSETFRKMDGIRFIVGAVLSFLILRGHLSLETLAKWLDTLSKVMDMISVLPK